MRVEFSKAEGTADLFTIYMSLPNSYNIISTVVITAVFFAILDALDPFFGIWNPAPFLEQKSRLRRASNFAQYL